MIQEKFMKIALQQAQKAMAQDEVPVGAVIVKDDLILSRAYNKKEKNNCSVYHAEIEAIRKACKKLGNWHLDDCDIYVTLEPCSMCAGAIINSRIANVYFGAYDPKAGCCGTLYNLPTDKRFNHTANVQGGILQQQCAQLLSDFFRQKREQKKMDKQLEKQ